MTLLNRLLCGINCSDLLSFFKDNVSALFLCCNGLFRGKVQVNAEKSNCQHFKNVIYMKSVSIPLAVTRLGLGLWQM